MIDAKDLKGFKLETWHKVHHVREDGMESGSFSYYSAWADATKVSKEAGLGGVHVCRVTEVQVLVLADGRGFVLHQVQDETRLSDRVKAALAKLTAQDREALGLKGGRPR